MTNEQRQRCEEIACDDWDRPLGDAPAVRAALDHIAELEKRDALRTMEAALHARIISGLEGRLELQEQIIAEFEKRLAQEKKAAEMSCQFIEEVKAEINRLAQRKERTDA